MVLPIPDFWGIAASKGITVSINHGIVQASQKELKQSKAKLSSMQTRLDSEVAVMQRQRAEALEKAQAGSSCEREENKAIVPCVKHKDCSESLSFS